MRRNSAQRVLALLTALLCTGAAGCTPQVQDTSAPPEGTVNLVYYTIGEPDEDLALVNQELNRILFRKIWLHRRIPQNWLERLRRTAELPGEHQPGI